MVLAAVVAGHVPSPILENAAEKIWSATYLDTHSDTLRKTTAAKSLPYADLKPNSLFDQRVLSAHRKHHAEAPLMAKPI